jgi:hypothetical protein
MQMNNEIYEAYKYLCQLLHTINIKLSKIRLEANPTDITHSMYFHKEERDREIDNLVEKLNVLYKTEQNIESTDLINRCCNVIKLTCERIQLISYKISYIGLYTIRDNKEIKTLYPELYEYKELHANNANEHIIVLLASEYYVITKAINNISTEEKTNIINLLDASYKKCIAFLSEASIFTSCKFLLNEHTKIQSLFYSIDKLIHTTTEDFRLEFPKVTERIKLFSDV